MTSVQHDLTIMYVDDLEETIVAGQRRWCVWNYLLQGFAHGLLKFIDFDRLASVEDKEAASDRELLWFA